MKIQIYESFKHWFEKGNVWIYSDPHFNDPDQFSLRPNYPGDEEQVKLINSKIGKHDTLIILGDIGDKKFVKKLKGYKVLIKGNHDAGISKYKRKEQVLGTSVTKNVDLNKFHIHPYADWDIKLKLNSSKSFYHIIADNGLFDEVYEGPLFISAKILLSHEPIYYPFALNIHGHDHGNYCEYLTPRLNLCAELIDYTPISLIEIVKQGKLKNIDDIHRNTIDKASFKKEIR